VNPQHDRRQYVSLPPRAYSILLLCLGLLAFPAAFPGSAFSADVYFSPDGGIRQHLVHTIQQSRQHIDVAVYQITSTELASALVAAKDRGVRIRILTDQENLQSSGPALRILRTSGVAIRSLGVVEQSLMHNKFAVFDDRVVATGSYNWTQSAERANYENLVLLDDSEVVTRFQREFNRLWRQAEPW
jgi:phosphatidylserine/phosphatidylglycerophosphate/cardiolipin synthase-like enzyme